MPDHYRAHQGVPLPARFPSDFPTNTASRIDLDGDGYIRGWNERKAASLFFAEHFPNLASRPLSRSVADFLRHLVIVDEPGQDITIRRPLDKPYWSFVRKGNRTESVQK